jgi:predicted dehydrogenase
LYRRIMGEQGSIIWDWQTLEVFTTKKGSWEKIALPEGTDFEEMYVNEIDHFVKVIGGERKLIHTLEEEKRVLQIMLAAEESSLRGRQIQMSF